LGRGLRGPARADQGEPVAGDEAFVIVSMYTSDGRPGLRRGYDFAVNDDEAAHHIFEIQLELEEMTPAQVCERAGSLRLLVKPERRIAFSIQIWAALHRSRELTQSQRDELLSAWCRGLGVEETDVLDAVDHLLRREITAAEADRPAHATICDRC